MPELADCITPLVPVADWDWGLYKIIWWDRYKAQSKVLWLISDSDGMWDTVQDRWPSDHWVSFDYERVQDCKEPPRVYSQYGIAHVNCWDHGEKLARELKHI